MNEDLRALRGRLDRLERKEREQAVAMAGVIRDLASGLAAVNGRIQRYATTVSLVNGLNDVTVTWPTAWPDSLYWVGVELQTSSAAIANIAGYTVKAGTRDTTGCVITIQTLASVATVLVNVTGIR